jgi:hypothetical protein
MTIFGQAKNKSLPNKRQKNVGCSLQGVLAQAKNCDKLFWQEEFHAANGKTQACTQGALLFFLFEVWGRGGGRGKDYFFHFALIPNVFPLCSLQVPNGFPSQGDHPFLGL